MGVQHGGHSQGTENSGLNGEMCDEASGSAEFPGDQETGFCYSEINFRFFMFRSLILESSVERGIPSFVAAPFGPATFDKKTYHGAKKMSALRRSHTNHAPYRCLIP
jgi:hypothetical protein